MHPPDLVAIAQLIVVAWGLEMAVLSGLSRARAKRDGAEVAAIGLIVLVLVGVTAMAPPRGAYVLGSVIFLHGLIVAPIAALGFGPNTQMLKRRSP